MGGKWAEEVNSEVFAARLVWAVGYFVEPSYFVGYNTKIFIVNTRAATERRYRTPFVSAVVE